MRRTCMIEGCNAPVHAKDRCKKHYSTYCYRQKLGITRTIRDANEIIVDGDIAYMKLYNSKGECIATTTVDKEDLEKITKFKWYKSHNRQYVVHIHKGAGNNVTYLHRLVMDAPDELEVDHIDGNALNNCKSNLRLCNSQQNKFNKKFYRNNTIPGVTVSTRNGKEIYRARLIITVDGKKLDKCKYFESRDDAVAQRLAWEQEYYKDFNAHAI